MRLKYPSFWTESDVFDVFRDPYVLAIRSVTLPTHPPTEDMNRGEMLCAGFTIYAVSENVSKVSGYLIFEGQVPFAEEMP